MMSLSICVYLYVLLQSDVLTSNPQNPPECQMKDTPDPGPDGFLGLDA